MLLNKFLDKTLNNKILILTINYYFHFINVTNYWNFVIILCDFPYLPGTYRINICISEEK